MAPRKKQDYPALIEEYERRVAAESIQAIKADFQSRGIHWGTFQNHRTAAKKKAQTTEDPMSDETPVAVLDGQMSIEDADTPPEVHYGAVNEFDALPEGYAKVIQPMRPYTDAEEWALNKSMELYGFIGTIVYDQYGRILDGHHRQRVARLRGLGAPFTITHVRDDAHALEIARSLNAVRRQYTHEERLALAMDMREHGFAYQAIADALGVGKATVYRDIVGVLRVRAEDIVPTEQSAVSHEDIVPTEQSTVNNGDIVPTEQSTVSQEPSQPAKRVQRKGGGTYPAQRSSGTKPTTSAADRQLAQVINLLMSHAQQWSDQHWQAFLEVVQNLRGSKAVAPATE